MKKIKVKPLVIISVFFVFFSISSKALEQKKFEISEKTFKRIQEYVSGNIYSHSYNRKISNVSTFDIAISEDGQFSVFSYCRYNGVDANTCQLNSPHQFQIKKKCERISGQKCLIVAEKKYFVLDSNKKKIDMNNLQSFFKIKKTISESKIYYSDIEINSSKDFESDYD